MPVGEVWRAAEAEPERLALIDADGRSIRAGELAAASSRRVAFTGALPRDPNGKLYERVLRDPYWKDRERSI